MQNPTNSNKDCGSRLKAARKAKNLTQNQLAELANVDFKYISLLENNHRKMSFDLAIRLEEILNVRHEYLLGYDDHKSKWDKFASQKFERSELLNYCEILERNGYILSTPFGPDGDTALMTILSDLAENLVISHNGNHYKCSSKQFHYFLQNTSSILDQLRDSLVQQFLSCVCTDIDEGMFQEEMSSMKKAFDSKYGKAGAAWLREQAKVDAFDFDSVNDQAYSQSLKEMQQLVLEDAISVDQLKTLKKHLETVLQNEQKQ